MRPDYKKIKVLAEFCPICKEQLQGNNSTVNRLRCSCGVWKSNFLTPMEYTIEPNLAKEQEHS